MSLSMDSRDPSPSAASKRYVIAVIALIVVEAVVVLGACGMGRLPILGGDGPDYDALARNLLYHNVFSSTDALQPTMVRTPGYPLFLAGIYAVTGPSVLAVRVTQFALLAATSLLTYLLARRFASELAARIAGVLVATYAPFVFIAAWQLSETLATFTTVLFLFLLHRAVTEEHRTYRLLVFLGLVLGYAVLVRAVFALMLFVAIAALLLPFRRGYSARKATLATVVMVASSGLVVGPWALRNIHLSRAFYPLSTTAGNGPFMKAENLSGRLSYAWTADDWKYMKARSAIAEEQVRRWAQAHPRPGVPFSIQVEVDTDRHMRELGNAALRNIPWTVELRHIPVRVRYLWAAADFSPWQSGLFHRLVQLQYAALILMIVAGMILRRRELMSAWPLWVYAFYVTVVFVGFFPIEARETLPARAPLLVYAAVAAEAVFRKVTGSGTAAIASHASTSS